MPVKAEQPTYWFVMRKHTNSRVPWPLEEERQGLCSCSPSLCVGGHKHAVDQSWDLQRRIGKDISSVKWETFPPSSRTAAHFLALMHIKSAHSQSTLPLWKESRDDPLEGNLVSCTNGLKFIPPSLSQMTVLWVLLRIRIHTEVRVTHSYVIPALGR